MTPGKGSDETILDLENPSLFIVRAGAFDVNNSEGELLDRVVEGGFFGFVSLLTGSSGGNTVKVHEDGLLYQIDKKAFKRLRERCDEIDQFFNNAFEQRLRVGLRARADNQALAARIGDIMTPKFESVGMNASIEETAKRMAELNIASIGVTDQDGKLGGIFTDKEHEKNTAKSVTASRCNLHSILILRARAVGSLSSRVHRYRKQPLFVHVC